jgi:hypothetical protein
MHAHPLFRHLGAIAALFGVALPVAGGAQIVSGPPATEVATFGSAIVTNAVGFTAADMNLDVATATGPPAGLRVPRGLRPQVERMWRTSPTFRRQCLRLSEASVTVIVYFGLPRSVARATALARIERQHGLTRRADVYLDVGLVSVHETLAHELEHVLEQIDGVNLPALVASRVHGVREVEPGAFETARAAAIGRLVAHEVSRQEPGPGREL